MKKPSRKPRMKATDENPIKKLRKALGLSQEQFAEKIGVQRTSVVHWESGRNAPNGAAQKTIDEMAAELKKKKK